MSRNRTSHDGSRQPLMVWDEDEAATRSYQRDGDENAGDDAPIHARVIPLLRAPHSRSAPPHSRRVPSLREHVEAQRAEIPYASRIEVSGARVHIDIPVPPPPRTMSQKQEFGSAAPRWDDVRDEPDFEAEEQTPPDLPAYESHIRPACDTLSTAPRSAPPRARRDSPGHAVQPNVHQQPPSPHLDWEVARVSTVRGSSPPPISVPPPQPRVARQAVRFAPPIDEYGPLGRAYARRPRRRSNAAWIVAALAIIGAACFLIRDSLTAVRTATAIVPVSPLDARVSIDGQELAPEGGLFKVPDLAPDRDHVIEVSHKGFVSETRRVRLNPGDVRVLPSIDLEPVPAAEKPASSAARAAEPSRPAPDAVRNARVSATRPAAIKPAPVIQAAKARPVRRALPPRPSARDVEAEPDDSALAASRDDRDGIFRINTLPWSEVTIDGRLIGTTPQQHVALAPGRHKVTLVNPELGISKRMVIHIEPGETLTKSISLVD